MSCRGICIRYKVRKPPFRQGRYVTGQKRCQICETFLEWNGLRCPCCSYRLRLKPRNMKAKIGLLSNKDRQMDPKALAIPILAPSFG